MRISCFILAFTMACQIPANDSKEENKSEIDLIFQEIEAFQSSAEDSLYLGYHPVGDWASVSHPTQLAETARLKEFIAELTSISDGSLSSQALISKKVMLLKLRNEVSQVEYQMHLIPFNAEGGFYNAMGYVLGRLSFNAVEDFYSYLHWLPHYHKRLIACQQLMERGIDEGIVAPKIVVKNTLSLLKAWSPAEWSQSPFYSPFLQMPNNIDEQDKSELLEQAENKIKMLNLTYKQLYDFFENAYYAAAKDNPGISEIPDGKAYYENRVQHYTTLALTPDSVHLLGLAEVARIRQSMDQIIADLNYEGSFNDFLTHLRTDAQFYPKTPQELLHHAAWLSKKAEGQLPKFFNTLYSLPFTVEPVPENIAPTYTTGRYVGGSKKTGRAGIYWVNTYDLPSRTLYTLPALTLHEAVPGHHLQSAIAAEIKQIATFRNNYYISAFGEGWGLYSEYLGEEMGMYETPYELFGRYTYEMWRACRLVVDTGIHYKGWSRQRALDYLASNTALSLHEVTTEIDRYIGWPGQALSYKIGEIKIKALRKYTEDELGDQFDIKEFHDIVLKNGAVPLDVLEEQINAYLLSKKN